MNNFIILDERLRKYVRALTKENLDKIQIIDTVRVRQANKP